MNTTKKYSVKATGLLCCFILLSGPVDVLKSQEYFPRGIFGLDNPPNLHLNNDEKQLIYGTYANYLFGVVNDEPSVMIFCRDTTEGEIKMNVEYDPSGYEYHVYNPYHDPDPRGPYYNYPTTALWPYISRSYYTYIENSEIDSFVTHVYDQWGDDVTGMETILVTHQGHTGDSDWWPFIEHACDTIQIVFGDAVKSMVIHNRLYVPREFFTAVPHLDIFCHEDYPIYTRTQGDNVDYTGNEIQTCFNNLVRGYDSCMVVARDVNIEWQAIIQACEQQQWDTREIPPVYGYWRRPTESELWCQAFLALSRGAKGVHYYVYFSLVDSTGFPPFQPHQGYEFLGLVTNTRDPFNPYYTYVARLDTQLATLGPIMLPLSIETAFNCTNIPPDSYIDDIEGEQVIGTTGTIEIGIFQDPVNPDDDYFMLVNRLCSGDEQGNPADPQTITVLLESSSNRRLIEDALAIRTSWDGNSNRVAYRILDPGENSFVVTLNPGEGRLFRVTDGLAGNLTEDRYWSGEALITGNITVNPSATLTVHEGTKVYFEDNRALFVLGSLQALGTPGHRITFTSTQGDYSPSSWNYIRIVNTSQASDLTWCNVYSASTGIILENATGTVNIEDCRIRYNSIGVLGSNSTGSIWLQDTRIQNNQTGVWLNKTKPYIKHSDIIQNSQYGLYLYNQANAFLGYDDIYNNGEGVYCYYNSTPGLYGSTGHNWIYDNSGDGVSGRSNSYPKLGFDILVKYGWNHIYSNDGYEVANRNSGSNYIKAERNYWSASETNPVPPEDTYGLVDWEPVLPSGPPPKSGPENIALLLEVNEAYDEAVTEYNKLIDQSPKSEGIGFAVSGLVRCYEALERKSEITGLLDEIMTKYPSTAAEISAKELCLPFLLQEGFLDKGLERAKELLELNQGTDREDIFLFEMASFYLAKSNGKPGPDQDAVIDLYKTLVDRFPKSGLSLWADIWLKTVPSQSLGKWISQNEELSTITKPSDFSFSKNYPNPFNPETTVRYSLPDESLVLIEVYNVLGQKVATLVDENLPAGYHTARWDGNDAAGKKAPAGIYLCRMRACPTDGRRAGDFVKTQKMTLLP